MSKSAPVDVLTPRAAVSLDAGKQSLAAGSLQLAISVVLLSSAWPLTRIAIDNGSTPIWFAEARALVSGATIAIILAVLVNPWAIDWSSRNVLIGHAFLLGASLAWSVAIVVTRSTTPRSTMFELLPWCFAVGALTLAPLILLHAPHGGIGTQPMSWLALAYIGLVAGPFSTWCVIEATAALPAVVSSVGFLTTPAVSLILANLLLGEPITADLLAGSGLIVLGVGCAAWPWR
ncbi:MAG TPA: DMT family transporter [Acetobacteraceae bacterium]